VWEPWDQSQPFKNRLESQLGGLGLSMSPVTKGSTYERQDWEVTWTQETLGLEILFYITPPRV
jgi:hypothetical protein